MHHNTRSAGVNTNYKTFARLRPIDYQSKMVECTSGNTIHIRDPKQKERQSYNFSSVFDASADQETVWQTVCEPCIQKVIDGHNSCILSYGQTGGGKTYSIFGEDDSYSIKNTMSIYNDGRKDRRGFVPRTVEYLFKKAKEMEDFHEYVITCSMTEIYLNQIRDLGKAYMQQKGATGMTQQKPVLNANALTSNFENEKLVIYENTNGQIAIKDLTLIQIKDMSELHAMLAAGFQLRQRFVTKGNEIWSRAHTIFSINLVKKDKENENIAFLNSTIQFVDLAGSERVSKNINDGLRFQESATISSSLTALGKCLQHISHSNKAVPYRESPMTHVLQNCMGTSSFVHFLVNLNPSESNYEECLISLQFAERTKLQPTQHGMSNNVNNNNNNSNNNMSSSAGGAQLNGIMTNSSNMNAISQQQQQQAEENQLQTMGFSQADHDQMKRLNEENKDLRATIESLRRENREKLQEVKTTLGIDVDLEKLSQQPAQRFLEDFRKQREAVARLEEEESNNRELREQIFELSKNKKEEVSKQERQSSTIIELRDQVKRLKEQLSASKTQCEDEIRRINNEREAEIKAILQKSSTLLEEKTNKIFNLPKEIQAKTTEIQRQNEVKRFAKLELEKDFKTQIEGVKTEYARLLETTNYQYEQFLKAKNEQIETYVADMNKYRAKKKKESEQSKNELIELYEIVSHQNKLIQKIEMGHYTGGKRSLNIPSREKPNLPNRTSFQLLFKLLDQKHLKQMSNTSSSGNTNNMNTMTSASGAMMMQTGGSNQNLSSMNVTFGGTKIDGVDAMKTIMSKQGVHTLSKTTPNKNMHSTLLTNQAFKVSSRENNNNNNNMQMDVSSLMAQASLDKDRSIITDLNVDLVINLNKMKNKEEFPQLKCYAERLKESLQAALTREKELKERVQEFEKINNMVDIKTLQNERDEFKQMYMAEARKNNVASRGTMYSDGSSRKLFITTLSSQQTQGSQSMNSNVHNSVGMNPQRTSTPNGFYRPPGNLDSTGNFLGRPSTNTNLNRIAKPQERTLLPMFK